METTTKLKGGMKVNKQTTEDRTVSEYHGDETQNDTDLKRKTNGSVTNWFFHNFLLFHTHCGKSSNIK